MPTTEIIWGKTLITHSKEEWKTYRSPEQVSGILGYTFELPPPGPPPLKEGQIGSFQNADFGKPPLDSIARSRETRTGTIEARQDTLNAYAGLKGDMVAEIEKYQKTRNDLTEKLATIPFDDENMALRDQLTGYIKRLDNSLARTQSRLDELEKNYGPQGTYRRDIAADIPEWKHSGHIYNEKLVDKVFAAKTVDEILENVGKLFLDLKKKLAELSSDPDSRTRDEIRDYAIRVQMCFDSVKNRLKNEFGWEGGDLDLSAAWFAGKTDGFELARELGYTDPADVQDAFLAAIAGSSETWPSGAPRNPIDIINHFLRRTESTIMTTCARLKRAEDDFDGLQNLPWIPYRESTVPKGKVSNPALINELAEAAE
ncbi:MAG: hypothetical protein OJJ21_11170 [Ferrovibrio sp.]|uniref:hypothetical protein n=1 Tax=Ferrovibrio sp. TaxID=1917215 RepID=UPI00262F46FE|nr:hypothetical protein [Ferrovibrio sp.]MCW0234150.1 hypothetical protein [Ferrovibrio sp.]